MSASRRWCPVDGRMLLVEFGSSWLLAGIISSRRGIRTMPLTAAIIVALALLFWVRSLVAMVRTVRGLPDLSESVDPEPATWPRLAVVLPACNEAEAIGETLRTLCETAYPALEVLAVNDRSTDRTGEIMEAAAIADPRVRVLHIESLPDGWLGKVHAMWRASGETDADWLLFADADVRYAPDALNRAIARAEAHGLDLLSVFPHMESMGPVADVTAFTWTALGAPQARLWEVADPERDAIFGLGAFLLVRRSHLVDKTPGLQWLKLEVADDMGMALLIKAHGGRVGLMRGKRHLRFQWYAGYGELMRRTQKNWFVVVGRCSALRLVVLAFGTMVLGLAPLLALVPGVGDVVGVLGGLTWLAQIAAVAVGAIAGDRFPWVAPLVPIGCVLGAFVMLRSGWVGARLGGTEWRGTFYSSALLRDAQRVVI